MMVPRISLRRRQSRWPLLLRIIGFRIRLRLILWRRQAEQKSELALVFAHLGWLWLKWQFWRMLRRQLDWILPPRR